MQLLMAHAWHVWRGMWSQQRTGRMTDRLARALRRANLLVLDLDVVHVAREDEFACVVARGPDSAHAAHAHAVFEHGRRRCCSADAGTVVTSRATRLLMRVMRVLCRPRLHYRLLTLCPAPTDPVPRAY